MMWKTFLAAWAVIAGAAWSVLQPPVSPEAIYVGSAACGRCHAPIYERWKKTRMANVVKDPREHPDAIVSDFSTPNPLVTVTKDQIAFVYGGKWKQRYFRKVGDDFSPLPATWDVTNRQWRPYAVTGATSQLCDGCHSVNYDIKTTKTVTEWNVGCERYHGPGSEHIQRPSRASIVNPSRLDPVAAVDGLRLNDLWQLDGHTPGTMDTLHFADGTARENRMQGNDYVQSLMYARGVTCASCHDPHGTPNNADLIKSARMICLTCHGPKSPNGPRTTTIEQHTHHRPESAGSECVSCHMPRIAVMVGDVKVRSHTFKFIAPGVAERLKMPDPCTTCHTEKTSRWAADALRSWPEFSPWRGQ